jgi:ABC-type glycerol-3-phosphate transport system substrate-binding protein
MRHKIFKFIAFFFLLGHIVLAGWSQTTPASSGVSTPLPVSIYYSLPNASAQVIEAFIAEYRQTHPYLDIKTKNFPQSEEMYKTLTKPGDVPTLAILETSWLEEITNKQPDFLPVETWMPRETFLFNWSVKCNCQLTLWDGSHVAGKLMALPYFFTTRALIINPDVFAKAGIKSIPATWDDFLKAAKKLANPKTADGLSALALSVSGSNEMNGRTLQILNWQHGGNGLGGVEVDSTEKASVSITSWKPILAPWDGPSMNPNSVAAWIGNVDDYFTLKQRGLNLKVATLPGTDKRSRMTETQGWALGMFKTFPDRELYKIQELAFYLLDFPQQRRLAEQTPYLAAHVKVFDNPFYRKERLADHANLRVFLNAINGSRLLPSSDAQINEYRRAGQQLNERLKAAKVEEPVAVPAKPTTPAKPKPAVKTSGKP